MGTGTTTIGRERLELEGQVQGVGFRPCVYRVASRLGLGGFVLNDSRGAVVEVEGPTERIEAFVGALVRELPPLARVSRVSRAACEPRGQQEFQIERSLGGPERRAEVTPDAATCRDCVRELFDPSDWRYGYAFINCTNCGPRYSIVHSVPYDRAGTTMSAFALCERCAREYGDPRDRRFHAQPVACAACGPRLRLLEASGAPRAGDPLREAAAVLRSGGILAIKGIGGFHLACDAMLPRAVDELRRRKLRDGKPLALMVPDLAIARGLCELSAADEEALRSPAAPIVLARRRAGATVAAGIAPGSAYLGVMLPYAPIHHLLLAQWPRALVMTSANQSERPLTYVESDALRELSSVADAFLTHDREIFRPIDDSVVFTFRGAAVPVRRARGYVPAAIEVAGPWDGAEAAVLALGGELKNTVCLWKGKRAIVSEHLGDLTNAEAYRHYCGAVERLCGLFEFKPEIIVRDLHPNYLSSALAGTLEARRIGVQHHHAHVASVMAETGEHGPVIGLACDGAGYGTDGAVWGCEVLCCERGASERIGHMAYVPLVGGDAAAVETWRPAAALLRSAWGGEWLERGGRGAPCVRERFERLGATRLSVFAGQAARGLNAPPTSSLGRAFDAAAFLLGLCDRNRYEGEAAAALEAAAVEAGVAVEPFAYRVECGEPMLLNLAPALGELADAVGAGGGVAELAARFHETVARMLADAAESACERKSVATVVLSGGCFANRILLSRVVDLLEGRGLRVLMNRHVPAGDGGLSLGQAYVAMWRAAGEGG